MIGGLVRLFHGTTRRAAGQIRARGWEVPPKPDSLISAAATEYEVDATDLRALISAEPENFLLREGRSSMASFTLIQGFAGHQWAQRAPEARRELLWAVWRLQHPGHATPWHHDLEGNSWVLGQMADDDPVALECAWPHDELLALGAIAVLNTLAMPLPSLEVLTPGSVGLLPQEIAIPLPLQPPTLTRLHVYERHVDWDVFAHLLGLEKSEFVALADHGKLGPKGSGDGHLPDHRAWWPLQQVERVLDRRGCDVPWRREAGTEQARRRR